MTLFAMFAVFVALVEFVTFKETFVCNVELLMSAGVALMSIRVS
jgi:hypothetical protein